MAGKEGKAAARSQSGRNRLISTVARSPVAVPATLALEVGCEIYKLAKLIDQERAHLRAFGATVGTLRVACHPKLALPWQA
jgi:hypothetical protein